MNNEIKEKMANIVQCVENNTKANWGSDKTWQLEFEFLLTEIQELGNLIGK